MLKGHILLIGCGNMGSALLAGWLRSNEVDASTHVSVVDTSNKISVKESPFPFASYTSLEEMPASPAPDMIVLAVKPQHMETVVPICAKHFSGKPLYISIAAGVTLDTLEGFAGGKAKVARAMPNTPALIARGMTSLVANKSVSSSEKKNVSALFAAVGEVLWLKEEEFMHAATALAGSAPAYLYYFAECMVDAGIKAGMSEDDATLLATTALEGAASLAKFSGSPLAELRRQVTSPGGTTEAAIKSFQKGDALKKVVADALEACMARSRELSEK